MALCLLDSAVSVLPHMAFSLRLFPSSLTLEEWKTLILVSSCNQYCFLTEQ